MRQKTVLVCPDCRARGRTPRDIRLAPCSECKEEYGVDKFDEKQWYNFHNLDRKRLICTSCRKYHAERLERLKRLVQKPDSWRCTCRDRLAGHAPKCPLTPTRYGERRWPGKNKGVLLEDKDFLDQHQPEWWLKSRGRR